MSATGLVGAAVLGSAGCGHLKQGGQQGGDSGGQKAFSYQLGAEIPDMDPSTTTDLLSITLITNVMEGLYRIDENEKPQPAHAEGVDISGDELTYTFALRNGIKWSNGEPVTSRDFKYSWLRAMDPETAAPYSYIIAPYIKGGAEFNAGEGSAEDVAIETPDDKTLKVTLVNPVPFFLSLTAFQTYFPQSQQFVEQKGEEYAQSADALLYNGPFTMTQLEPAQGATLTKSEDYWDKENVAEEMDASSINGTTFKLFKKGTTTNVPAAVSYDQTTDKATLDPTEPLKKGATYKALVTTGAKDLVGNRLDQNGSLSGLQQKKWFFTVTN